MKFYARLHKATCESPNCGRVYMAVGAQKFCSPACKALVMQQRAEISRIRRGPPITYCPCGKPCKMGETFCSLLCERIAS